MNVWSVPQWKPIYKRALNKIERPPNNKTPEPTRSINTHLSFELCLINVEIWVLSLLRFLISSLSLILLFFFLSAVRRKWKTVDLRLGFTVFTIWRDFCLCIIVYVFYYTPIYLNMKLGLPYGIQMENVSFFFIGMKRPLSIFQCLFSV